MPSPNRNNSRDNSFKDIKIAWPRICKFRCWETRGTDLQRLEMAAQLEDTKNTSKTKNSYNPKIGSLACIRKKRRRDFRKACVNTDELGNPTVA